MPRLIGQSPDIAGQAFDLTEALVTVGRTPDNTIHLTDNSVAAHHAELAHEGAEYTVRDLGSETGTQVNGQAVTIAVLNTGDVLRIGNLELYYEGAAAAPAPQAAAPAAASAGISLDACVSRGRPAHFVSAGRGLRAAPKDKVPWPALAGTAIALAVLAILYWAYVLATTPITG